METLQIILLTLSSTVTLFCFAITLHIIIGTNKIKNEMRKDMPEFLPKLQNKLSKLFKGDKKAYDDFSKDEMACSILIIGMNVARLRMTTLTMIAAIVTLYVYHM